MAKITKHDPAVRRSPARQLAEEMRAKKGFEDETVKNELPLDGFTTKKTISREGPAPLGLMQVQRNQGGQSAMNARLGAMQGNIQPLPGAGGLKRSEGGRVLSGDVTITRADDLRALHGVEVLKGDLVIEESMLASGDLSALSSLTKVEGNLALEGNGAVNSLEALKGLAVVDGNVYLGFNGALKSIELPALTRVGGALIVEGNDALEQLKLPALEAVGGYLHLHENGALDGASAPKLSSVGREVSIEDNPRLKSVSPTLVA